MRDSADPPPAYSSVAHRLAANTAGTKNVTVMESLIDYVARSFYMMSATDEDEKYVASSTDMTHYFRTCLSIRIAMINSSGPTAVVDLYNKILLPRPVAKVFNAIGTFYVPHLDCIFRPVSAFYHNLNAEFDSPEAHRARKFLSAYSKKIHKPLQKLSSKMTGRSSWVMHCEYDTSHISLASLNDITVNTYSLHNMEYDIIIAGILRPSYFSVATDYASVINPSVNPKYKFVLGASTMESNFYADNYIDCKKYLHLHTD